MRGRPRLYRSAELTAATLASRGSDVIGVDINPDVVTAANAGEPYFPEPDLDMLLRAATTLGELQATERPEAADAVIIAVPTRSAMIARRTSDLSMPPRMRSHHCLRRAMS
jgi:UDP-N-acetyl-D-mannosaminuronate dehydrogenase